MFTGVRFIPLLAACRLRLGASGAERLCAPGALDRARTTPQLHRQKAGMQRWR